MAHAGTCGGGGFRSGHSNQSRKESFKESGLEILIILGIYIISSIFESIFSFLFPVSINGKSPLPYSGNFYETYIVDEKNYFENINNAIEGLEYLYKSTNIQMVVLISKNYLSESNTLDMYYEMFDDECHVLYIYSTSSLYESTYAIGDLANEVIDDKAINYLNKKLKGHSDGEYWKENLINFSDELLSD